MRGKAGVLFRVTEAAGGKPGRRGARSDLSCRRPKYAGGARTGAHALGTLQSRRVHTAVRAPCGISISCRVSLRRTARGSIQIPCRCCVQLIKPALFIQLLTIYGLFYSLFSGGGGRDPSISSINSGSLSVIANTNRSSVAAANLTTHCPLCRNSVAARLPRKKTARRGS